MIVFSVAAEHDTTTHSAFYEVRSWGGGAARFTWLSEAKAEAERRASLGDIDVHIMVVREPSAGR